MRYHQTQVLSRHSGEKSEKTLQTVNAYENTAVYFEIKKTK